jgi:glycerophosphoryl diester phosphodiesterase
MADAPKLLGTDTLRQAYPKLNQAIDNSNQALGTANTAKSTAETALANSESTQTQLDTIVINGDSSVEAAQARVASDGTTYTTLQERLNSSDTQLAENAQEASKIRSLIASENERIAHRGFSGAFPENTMIAFGKAIEAGFESLEWDVQISSDGFPVVIHDSTVDRTTNGTGNVKDKTLANLRTLDAGSKYSAFYAGAKIPTLEEVLQISKGVSKFIYPEIKDFRTIDDTLIITQAIIDSGLEDKCIIQAANFNCFSYVRSLSRSITLGYLIGSAEEFSNALNLAKTDNKAVIIAEQYVLINNPSYVTQARAEDVDIIAWTVDTSRAMKKLRDIGVVRVMQNHLRSVVR